ncbi:MAG: hypothetical protein AB8G05_23260 [Oligoflexales bacterium]
MRIIYFFCILVLLNCSRESLPGYKTIRSADAIVDNSSETDEDRASSDEDNEIDGGVITSEEDAMKQDVPNGSEESPDNNLSGMEFVGDPESALTFDDVQDLFITDPASGFEGCTAAGCHGADPDARGQMVSSDLSSFETITDVEGGQSGLLIMYLTKGGMPKGASYAVEDIQKIADWVAAGMAPGAPPVVDPGANLVVTADIAALFAADKGNCSAAGCHGGNQVPNLLDDLKASAPDALDRLERYALGDATPMPPAGAGVDLLPAEVDMLRNWIDAGMPD